MSFNDWREERLVDICDLISRGITPSYTDDKNEGVIVINQKCIRDNCINLDLARLTNPNKKKIADNKYLKLYDILVNSTGVGTLGRVAQVKKLDEKITVDSHVTIVRAKKEIHPVFLGYNLFMNERYIEYLGEGSTGQTELSRIRLGEALKVKLPPIEEQKSIANILSTLDDKIEVNNNINQKLEEMAQTIFKQWFIEFDFPNEKGKPHKSSGGEMVESELGIIPKGWEVIELNKIANLTMGLSPKSIFYNTEGEGIPLLNGAADFDGGLIKPTKYTTQETRVCNKKDLIFCIRATIGNITFADKEYCLGRGVASIKPKKEIYVGLIYMNLLKSMERLKAQATGSVILGLSKPDINDMKLTLPNYDVINKFSKIFKSLFDKKHILEIENEKLSLLRNTLLPKLMSGEIRVPTNN